VLRGSELLSLGVSVSARSDILLYHSLILLELFNVHESILCSHIIFIQFCESLLSLVPIRDYFHLFACVDSFGSCLTSFILSNYSLHFVVLSSITKKGEIVRI
jgi:hypothetical protein